jgi:uncharacterized protein YecT (DUF1311 family)
MCSFPSATLIEQSPEKVVQVAQNEAHETNCLDVEASNRQERVEEDLYSGSIEIDDEKLNQAYDELLTQEFNPDAEDFEDDTEDVHIEAGKSVCFPL